MSDRLSKTDLLTALDKAFDAMCKAALALERRYGDYAENAMQLRGAAVMIKKDWMPAIEKESDHE